MRSIVLSILLSAAAGGVSADQSVFRHELWDQVLDERVNQLGEVDYEELAGDREKFDAYLALLAGNSPQSDPALFPSEAHELAYWMNAYNAFAIRGVLDHYPLDSVRDVDAFFDRKVYNAGGRLMSLDDIEHRTLRADYQEPRIHFAIVCASVSCPKLSDRALKAENLDKQLAELAGEFVSQQRNVRVEESVVMTSKIFHWFREDFEKATGEKGDQAILSFVLQYADEGLAEQLRAIEKPKVKAFDYDWGLNRPGSRANSSNPLERALAKSSAKP